MILIISNSGPVCVLIPSWQETSICKRFFPPSKPAEGADSLEKQQMPFSDIKVDPSVGGLNPNTLKICKEGWSMVDGKWTF